MFLKEVYRPFIYLVLKSTKNSSLKIERKNMRTFHVQLLFQAVTEGYSNHRVQIKIHMHGVLLIFFKRCREKLSFCNLILGEQRWKHVAQQIFPTHRTIYFTVTENKFDVWKYIFSRTQAAYICSNSTLITVE